MRGLRYSSKLKMLTSAHLKEIAASEALHSLQQSTPVSTLLSQQLSSEQNDAQKCLRVLFTTVGHLARQGLAFRGHDEQEGNFL